MWKNELLRSVETQHDTKDVEKVIRAFRLFALVTLVFVLCFWYRIQAKADDNVTILYAPQVTQEQVVGYSPTDGLVVLGVAPFVDEAKAVEAERAKFKYNEEIPLSADVQEYIWEHCKAVTSDYENYYYYMLGAIQLESQFKQSAKHYNSNGSIDRGLCQINSVHISELKRNGLISCTEDLFNLYKNIDCGFEIMNPCVEQFGVTEEAYYSYNTGRKKPGRNKNSKLVMQYMSEWKQKLSA